MHSVLFFIALISKLIAFVIVAEAYHSHLSIVNVYRCLCVMQRILCLCQLGRYQYMPIKLGALTNLLYYCSTNSMFAWSNNY